MVKYICEKCSKTFIRKTEYTRHVNRKFPCGNNAIDNDHNDQKREMNNHELIETIKYLKEKDEKNTAIITTIYGIILGLAQQVSYAQNVF